MSPSYRVSAVVSPLLKGYMFPGNAQREPIPKTCFNINPATKQIIALDPASGDAWIPGGMTKGNVVNCQRHILYICATVCIRPFGVKLF